MKITIEEVAKKAGVSKATVSRVLNNKSWVSPETRQMVLEIIKKLNFSPSEFAKRLGSHSERLGIVGALISESYYGSLFDNFLLFEILKGIGEVVDENNESLLLKTINHTDYQGIRDGKGFPFYSNQRIVDGIIIAGIPVREQLIKDLILKGHTVVVVGRYRSAPYRILVDNYGGLYKVTDYLISLGHTKIAIIVGPLEFYSFHDKLLGFKDSLKKHGIAIEPEFIVEEQGDPTQGGYRGMEKILSLKERPSAVIATDMNQMAGVFRYLGEKKIRVPEDISIAGYRGEDINSIFPKSVTRIRIGERNIGRVAARMLYDVFNNLIGPRMDITLSTELIIGDTCKRMNNREVRIEL